MYGHGVDARGGFPTKCEMSQLSLPVGLKDHAVFASFYPGPNKGLINHLQAMSAGQGQDAVLWLWGGTAVGKSHLLQAACAWANAHHAQAAYLPMSQLKAHGPDTLEGWESCRVVCVDDIQLVTGDTSWEGILFGLFNRLWESSGRLILAADQSPAAIQFLLPDLRSRFSSGPVYHLKPLGEPDRLAAMRLRARYRGFDLPRETAEFLIKRYPRDMRSLYDLLDSLDKASLAAQRRLTIPFVKDVLASAGAERRGSK